MTMQTFREFVDELNKHIPISETKQKDNKYNSNSKDSSDDK